MSKLCGNPHRAGAGIILGAWLTFSGCGFADLRPVSFSTRPSQAYAVLPGERTPLELRFGADMEHREAERALAVSNFSGSVEGDLTWDGRTLQFHPVEPWSPGVLYTLSVSGSIRAADGRELRPSASIPFYAVSRASVPVLSACLPPSGASVGVDEAGGAFLLLTFSEPMDRRSVEDALSLEGVSAVDRRWESEDRAIRLVPKERLSPWTVYRWTLGAKAKSARGVPLARGESGSFSTDADRTLPTVLRTFTALRSGAVWTDSGEDLGMLDLRCGIGVRFSKSMSPESMSRSIRLEPSVPGRAEPTAADTAVFVPERDLDGRTTYTLVVSADTADLSGLRLGEDYRENFRPAAPFVSVAEVKADGTGPAPAAGPYGVPISEPDGLLSVSIRFSHPFSTAAAAEAPFRISLEAHFPGTLSPPALRSAWWPSPDTLRMTWVGLEKTAAGTVNYYRLYIPGGGGLAMADDFVLYLEALP